MTAVENRMALQPKRICSAPGCRRIVTHGRCAEHARKQSTTRAKTAARGYGGRWQRASKLFLAEHPLCVTCEARGLVVAASQVDHIQRHGGDDALFWNEENWQALCHRCHSRKTARGE